MNPYATVCDKTGTPKLTADGQTVVGDFLAMWPGLPWSHPGLGGYSWAARDPALKQDMESVANVAVCNAVLRFDPKKVAVASDNVLLKLRPYILKFVHRSVNELMKQRKKASETETWSIVGDLTCPHGGYVGSDDGEQLTAVREAVDGLPEPLRTAVAMRFGIGREQVGGFADIGSAIGTTRYKAEMLFNAGLGIVAAAIKDRSRACRTR